MDLISRIIYNLVEVHPLHTLLVHFPIALCSAGLFFILLAVWRRSDSLELVAACNIALVAASTVAAGITGAIDNINTYDGAAPNAMIKVALASALLLVTLAMSVARWRNQKLFHSPARMAYILGYFVSFGFVAVLGFLGGVILYGFQEVPQAESALSVNADISQPALTESAPTAEPVITGVSFVGDVLPILKARCINCHGGQKTEESLDLTSYKTLMAGAEDGAVVLPGDAAGSSLATELIEKEMPKRGPKLSAAQIQLIVDWINQGALDN